jgi:hypothetical protein
VARIGPEVKTCTLREELSFCNPSKAPTCAAAEERFCAADKLQGVKQCKDCLQTNSAALMKDGCHASDETQFCGGNIG